jgi:hypothetical protein
MWKQSNRKTKKRVDNIKLDRIDMMVSCALFGLAQDRDKCRAL